MNKLELQAYRLVKRRFKINQQKDLIKVKQNQDFFLLSIELIFEDSLS